MDQTLNKPRVTVLMAVYNSEKYLAQAIRSILQQSYADFEFIVINDGSTDRSLEIIRSYTDSRIKQIRNEKNMGHTYCLNLGLSMAKGEYVARMDSDDISLPSRLSKQVKFMDENQSIAVCGTWTRTIGNSAGYINRFFTDPEDIKANLLFYTSLAHPTVMIRRQVLTKHDLMYAIEIDQDENSEDYGLWTKLSSRGERLANIPEVLLLFRMHPQSVTHIFNQKNKLSASAIRRHQLLNLGLSPTQEEMVTHNSPKSNLEKQEKWLSKILNANKISRIYNQDSLGKIIYHRWYESCSSHTKEGLTVYSNFTSSPLYKIVSRKRFIGTTKILIRALLRK